MHYNCNYKNPFKLHLHKFKFFDKQQNSILSRTHGCHPDSSFRESPADHLIQAAILLIDWVPPCNHKCRLLPTCLVESLQPDIRQVEEPGSIPRFLTKIKCYLYRILVAKIVAMCSFSWFILGSFFCRHFQNCLFFKDFFDSVKCWAW